MDEPTIVEKTEKNEKGKRPAVTVPPEQAWLYYTLEKQSEILNDIRSNTGWILAVALISFLLSILAILF